MTAERLPRLTITLDEEMAHSLRIESAARMQSRADVVRDAIRHELRIRQAANEAVRREVERQRAAARRIAKALEHGPAAALHRAARQTAATARAVALPSPDPAHAAGPPRIMKAKP